MMRIFIHCHGCGHDFSAPEKFVGRRVVCPECSQGVRVVDDGSNPSGEVQARSGTIRRAHGGQRSLKGLIVVGVIALLMAGAAGLNTLPGLLQIAMPPVANPPNLITPAADVPGNAPFVPENVAVGGTTPAYQKPQDSTGVIPAEVEPEDIAEMDPDDAPALADVPANAATVPERRPTKQSPPKRSRPMRENATDEIDTEVGQRLLAELDEFVIVRDQPDDDATDSRSMLWKRVVSRSKSMIEKTGVKQSSGKAGPRAAVLTVTLDSEFSESGSERDEDWTITAELICVDDSEDAKWPRYAKVWQAEQRLGTLTKQAAKTGRVSGKIDQNLTEFIGGLRAARNRAARAVQKAKQPASDDESLTKHDN